MATPGGCFAAPIPKKAIVVVDVRPAGVRAADLEDARSALAPPRNAGRAEVTGAETAKDIVR
jgi:hypothetical protein